MIVRWGLDELPGLLAELEIERPLAVTTKRWERLELPAAKIYAGVRPHYAKDQAADRRQIQLWKNGPVAAT